MIRVDHADNNKSTSSNRGGFGGSRGGYTGQGYPGAQRGGFNQYGYGRGGGFQAPNVPYGQYQQQQQQYQPPSGGRGYGPQDGPQDGSQ